MGFKNTMSSEDCYHWPALAGFFAKRAPGHTSVLVSLGQGDVRVRISKKPLFHKSNDNTGKNCQNQLSQNPRINSQIETI